mgnify:CR=1 FL=1
MDIRARDTDRELLLEFSGEMDHHGARNALKEVEIAIDAALPRSLILDFAGVTFMDSSGIGVIIGRCKNLGYSGGDVSACHLNERVDKIFTVSGLKKIIQVKE